MYRMCWNGQTSIFFIRNTGREAFQMYLTAAVARFFGTGLSHMSLKLGTALAGFFTLPFIYLLGKEVGGRWVALLAFVLAGVAYWPNVIARVGTAFSALPAVCRADVVFSDSRAA
jgi:4-amino-4-deoxy-L-arabinose transferase-like glycosyltransferase